jgi:PAS domain S-box-containing protein
VNSFKRLPSRTKQVIGGAITLLLLLLSSFLVLYFQNSSWFSLLILFTLVLALHLPPSVALACAFAFSLYAAFFSLVIINAPVSAEIFFVVIVWLIMGYVPSKMQQLRRHSQESDEFHRGILEASPYGIVQTDLQGTITFCNAAQVDLSGAKQAEELIGHNAFDFIVPDQKEKALQGMRRVIEGQHLQKLEFTTYRLDGSTFTQELSVALLRGGDRRPVGFIGIARDVTQERQLEQENQERRRYLETLMEASPCAVVTLDGENRIKEWNRSAVELFGYTKEEALGRELDGLLTPEDADTRRNAQALTRRVYSGEDVPPTEGIRYAKDGVALHVIVAGAPIKLDQTIIGVVATYSDISELKRAQTEVQELLQEKEQLLKEVHHRIKNHMHTLSSILALHIDYYRDPRIREVFEEINTKIKIMQDIYQTLYTGTTMDEIGLAPFITSLIRDFQDSHSRNKRITFHSDVDEVTVSAKQSLPIGIIVGELITNALKYAFGEQDQGHITVAIHARGEGWLEIEVRDNGAGLPAGVREERDFGFGLSLVEGYVKQYDGELQLESRKGSRIKLTLAIEQS